MKTSLFGLFVFAFSLPYLVSAQNSEISVISPTDNLPPINELEPGEAIAQFIVSMIGYAAVLSVIAITVGGIMMILAVGQEEKFKKARKILAFAIIGFAIAASAYLIVQIITRLSFA
ncbi:hypothetical protein CSB09_00850 [Candidatus Gracilibacteria bacterium]|nr:MAG: hypothetical protein CSB09_00850 [Candidatus Gracilibacteria bacterium]